jgi:hypothetical protein
MRADDIAVYFDPPTRHLFGDRLFERESNPYAGDSILAPFAAVHDRLVAAGITVHTADLLPDRPDGRQNIVISYGTPYRMPSQATTRYRALARRTDVRLSAFFAMECPVVEPGMYAELPALHQLFRRVLSWSDSPSLLPFTGAPVPVERFWWPQSFDGVHEQLWQRQDRKFLVMMNANKLPRLYEQELYTERLRAVEYFHQFGEIDLYGRNWDRAPARVGKTRVPTIMRRAGERAWELRQRIAPDPLYTAAAAATRGPARSKSETFAQYRFALCFENSVLKGWMTEKLFDCFFTGTVPVYWGAPDILEWVPADCFIDRREFRDHAQLRSFLHALTPAQVQGYREAARAYLASPQYAPFRLETWVDLHARIIHADTGVQV